MMYAAGSGRVGLRSCRDELHSHTLLNAPVITHGAASFMVAKFRFYVYYAVWLYLLQLLPLLYGTHWGEFCHGQADIILWYRVFVQVQTKCTNLRTSRLYSANNTRNLIYLQTRCQECNSACYWRQCSSPSNIPRCSSWTCPCTSRLVGDTSGLQTVKPVDNALTTVMHLFGDYYRME